MVLGWSTYDREFTRMRRVVSGYRRAEEGWDGEDADIQLHERERRDQDAGSASSGTERGGI